MQEAIKQMNADFTNNRAPFDAATLPEQAVLESIRDEDRLRVLSYGVMLDYNRSADQLWSNILTLYNEYGREFFQPTFVAEETKSEGLASIFDQIGFRYCNRDARAWVENSEILVEHFGGEWEYLVSAAEGDAVRLMEIIEENGFLYLKGDKLCPFYVKVVNMNVQELDNVWELPIPVDVHVRRLTHDLAGEELSDDEIRTLWKQRGEEDDVNIMTADTGLWIIGNQWDNFGKQYWNEIRAL